MIITLQMTKYTNECFGDVDFKMADIKQDECYLITMVFPISAAVVKYQ